MKIITPMNANMAKKNNINPKSATQARIKRTEAYAERVRLLFAQTVNEILALNKSMPQLDEGEMFSFAGESMKRQKEVERLLRQLHSVATIAIEKGIRLEWSQANDECDKLVKSCFGKRALSSPEFAAWTQRNGAAMNAFIARSENGLNLSQRVWKSVEQLRDEMEVAITVSVGEGESAASMSRKVRQYLNDPDLMFRRFRYKDPETGEWRRKWKKRIKDPATGKVKWIDYDKRTYQDQWTGRGYYKSSAQNAMRVARTETNIAYRRADNERWQQMDFVLGQRVNLSRSHPKKDICDKLAGDYPVDFVFDGWHPQCFCFVTPILMDEDEMAKVSGAFLRGEKYVPRGKRITDYPDNFKQWVSEHKEDIAQSRDRGTEPYFIRNNAMAIDVILDPSLKKLTPQQIAAKRHEARTPEQEDEIRRRWNERKQRIEAEKAAAEVERQRVARINATANNVIATVSKRGFNTLGISTADLEAAIKTGNSAQIQAQTRTLALAMAAKQKLVKATAANVSKVADGWSEVDKSPIDVAIASGDVAKINAATRAVAHSVLQMKKAEQALSAIIPDAHTWHEQFTLAELQQVANAVENTISVWLKKHGYSDWDSAPLAHKKAKLEQEINALISSKKYSTWEVAKIAYVKKLGVVQDALDFEVLNEKLQGHKDYLTNSGAKSLKYKSAMKKLEAAILAKDKPTAELLIAELDTKKAELELKYPENPIVKIIVPKSTNNTPQKGHVGRGLSREERIEKVKELTGVTDDKEAEDLMNAVFGFSWQWDYEIRQVQCGNSVKSRHGHTTEEINKKAQDLETFIAKSPQWKGGMTYRGMSLSQLELDDLRAQLTAGTFNNLGSASWSTTESVSRGFASSHLGEKSPKFGDTKTFRVVLHTTKHKKATSIKHLSNFPGEDEVLASMACRYKLISEVTKGEFVYFEVESK